MVTSSLLIACLHKTCCCREVSDLSERAQVETRCFREAYTGLPVVRATENQKALNCVALKYSIPVSEE